MKKIILLLTLVLMMVSCQTSEPEIIEEEEPQLVSEKIFAIGDVWKVVMPPDLIEQDSYFVFPSDPTLALEFVIEHHAIPNCYRRFPLNESVLAEVTFDTDVEFIYRSGNWVGDAYTTFRFTLDNGILHGELRTYDDDLVLLPEHNWDWDNLPSNVIIDDLETNC